MSRYVPIVDWLGRYFRRPDNGQLIKLLPHQKRVLEMAFTPDSEGVLPYRLVVLSMPKKCLAPGERVCLVDGSYPRADELGDSAEVWSLRGNLESQPGFGPALATVTRNEGFDAVVEVVLGSGLKLRRTSGERVLTWDGWKPINKLAGGEYIATPAFLPAPLPALDDQVSLIASDHCPAPLASVPDKVLAGSNEMVARFLAFALNCAGAVIRQSGPSRVHLKWLTVDRLVADRLRLALLRLGLHGVIVKHAAMYSVQLSGTRQLRYFAVNVTNPPLLDTALESERTPVRSPMELLPQAAWRELLVFKREHHISDRICDLPPADPIYDKPAGRAEFIEYAARMGAVAAIRKAKTPIVWDVVRAVRPAGSINTIALRVPPYDNFIAGNVAGNSGKTCLAAAIMHWFAFCMAENNAELYCCSNDMEQSKSRVFAALRRAILAEPALRPLCVRIQGQLIELNNGAVIQALSSDWAGAAGSNPSLSSFDELWGFESESSRLLWEEMTPPPTRKNSLRVVTTYAGLSGTSHLLEDIYKRMVHDDNRRLGDPPIYVRGDTFCLWDHKPRMPWQTPAYYKSQREQPGFRFSAYRRQHENHWVAGEEGIEMDHWDQCVALGGALCNGAYSPPTADQNLMISVGVDAAVKRDRAAVVSCYRKDRRIWLGPRRWWQPSRENPLDIEATMEEFILDLHSRFSIGGVYYDPHQFVRSAQALQRQGVPMIEYPQTIPGTLKMTSHLLDLLRERQIVLTADDDLRTEAQMVVLKEDKQGRGVRLVKDAATKKIDSIVALAMAALGAERLPDYEDFKHSFLILPGRE